MPVRLNHKFFQVFPVLYARFPVARILCRFICPANQNLNPQSWKTSCRTGPGLYWLCGIAETGRHSSAERFISNQCMLDLGITLNFPTFREGMGLLSGNS